MAVGDFAFSEILTGTKKLYTKNTANETTVTTMQNAATATGNGISLDVSGMGTAICQVSGTFVGTITFEASLDNSVFDSIDVQKLSGGLISSVVTSTGFYKIPCNGVKYIRARVSSYTSGAITVNGYAEALSCSDNAIQLSGSTVQNAVILQTVTATFNSLAAPNQITYGKTWKISAANSFPVEIGKYRERVIAVHNNTDKVLNGCQIRQQFVTTKGLTHPATLHEVADIPAGSRVIFTKKNVPELALPFLGMFFQHNVGESGTITGTVEVIFVGGVL